jgi:transcriptional regulator NrdR family protein
MKCPKCGAWTTVKETRNSPTFGHIRRRECANEHRFTTQEIVVPQETIDEERRNHLANNKERLESVRASRPKSVRKSKAKSKAKGYEGI